MLHQTQVLFDRAVALERAGQWQDALQLCEQVYRKSWTDGEPETLTEAVIRIGFLHYASGESEVAQEHFALAVSLAELRDDHRRAGRALNGLAVLHQERGELDAAECTYRRARAEARLAEDELTAGDVEQNLGILANIRGNLHQALEHYQAALQSYESIEHQLRVARVLNNMGMLYIDLERLDEADQALVRALGICRETGDVVTEGIVHANRAELFLALQWLEEARASCDEAFEISSRLGDNRVKSEALKFYGALYRAADKPHLAEIHLRQAIAIARKYNNPLTEAESQRELALALRTQDRNREALEALNRAHALFSDLQARHDQADINKRFSQLEDDFLSLVSRWGESIEAKDLYTRGHCQRVADYACRIAQVAGIPEREMVWFRMGAFLHDVGKTEVPEAILNKPGRLTLEERAIMEAHTVIGDTMLSSIEFPWDIRPMVRWHHERWDGSGYPDRLAGEEIPLTARILRLADIFDALTTTRSYREPLSPDEAFRIMEDDHGSFDPELFEIFRALFPEFAAMVGGAQPSLDHPSAAVPAAS